MNLRVRARAVALPGMTASFKVQCAIVLLCEFGRTAARWGMSDHATAAFIRADELLERPARGRAARDYQAQRADVLHLVR